jgi:TPP-dependent pyruvate/acetoin dehydrogenase alpha subunit
MNDRKDMDLDLQVLKDLYRELLKLRICEDLISENYKHQEMRTAVHLGTGQEAIPVGICRHLVEGDAVFSQHRSHNSYLASGGSPFKLFAELHGSSLGASNGRGGSIHLTHSNKIFFASTAILGESLALATGAALAFKLKKTANISVVFFGDAVWEEGIIYECMNYAAIHSLPVLFVCENNFYSTESDFSSRKHPDSFFKNRAESFGLQSITQNGNEASEIFSEMRSHVESIRETPQPMYAEFLTYRHREHVGPNYDHEVAGRTFRSREEFEVWLSKDPIKVLEERIKKLYADFNPHNFFQEIHSELSLLFEAARSAPKPNPSELLSNSGDLL